MTEKCKPEYHRRTFEGLAPLTREVQSITRPILGKRGFASVDILGSWEEIIGPELARGITPEKLTFEKDKRINGTLYVKSAGGAFATLFEFQKRRVLERINGFFGYPAVAQIKIRQGSLKLSPKVIPETRTLTSSEEKELQKRVAGIKDEALRIKTYEIGKAILIKK